MSESRDHWGAVVTDEGTVFRVWAPKRTKVEVLLNRGEGVERHALVGKNGVFSGTFDARAGTRYRFELDGGEAFPDPCSRSQPEGPHGPSEVVDARAFKWTDGSWPGVGAKNHVVYELHVGAFTEEGTYGALINKLPYLKSLGVTLLELMPVNGFPGKFNWGYDGVNLWAPNRTYGSPDQLRAFIDAAHAHGLGVILDVVYNHFGPDGNYLGQFSDTWFNAEHPAEWGEAVNFDAPGSEGVRSFVAQNAAMWIREYHFDGLRLDATQNLFDASPKHIVAEITEAARAAAGSRNVWLVGEADHQERKLVQPVSDGGSNLDAIWVDDFHHASRVAATGEAEGYLHDYDGSARELVSLALRNSLYAGQHFAFAGHPRGTELRRTEPHRVVFALQNHDQISVGLRAERIHKLAGESTTRALTALQLLLPQTPMLFMGQEFFASTPFPWFVDHNEELQPKVTEGRAEFLSKFASVKSAIAQGILPTAPADGFAKARLDWKMNEAALAFHRELIHLRKKTALINSPRRDQFDAAVLSDRELVLRWFGDDGADLLLIFSLGADRDLTPCSEPLLAPPQGKKWQLVLSSEDARFGGRGVISIPDGTHAWRLQGRCATLLQAHS
ncbi:MAG: malto-oligosyltrehalose trehalohydrolase [Archangium sp.]